MSIRSKLLILLLLIATLPMFIAVLVGQVSTRFVGDRLTEQTQAQLIGLAETQMLQGAQAAARLAGAEARQINLAVMVQARTAADALETEREIIGGAGVWLAREDFDERARAVPGIETIDGQRVSFGVPSIIFAPDADPQDAARSAARLASMGGTFAGLRRLDPGLIASQYAATIDGAHCAYPGHGGYPEEYDPRERAWFELALASDDPGTLPTPIWGEPMVDASTGRVIITASAPIVLSDGTIAGVTGVDIVLRNLIDHFERQPTWTENEELMILSSQVEADLGEGQLGIYAQRSYDKEGADWRSHVELEPFQLDDPDESAALVRAIKDGKSGVVRTRRGGREILCAHAPLLSDATSLVLISPFEDIVAISDTIDREFWGIIATQLQSNIAIAAVVLTLVVIIAFRGARSVTRPVEELGDAVERVARGDLEARATVRSDDEIGRLARNFNRMVPKLNDRVRLRQSLDLAMEVQQALLPGEPPSLDDLDVDGHSIYCDETGGDYYDFMVVQPLDSEHLWIVMGDVTGHGIAAALLMTTARAIVRSRVGIPGSMAEHASALNAQLAADNQHGRFMTMCVLLLDRASGRMRWVLAGHDPPIVYDPASDACHELESANGGIPLGIDADWTYHEHEGAMPTPGQVLVVGTDGIWEARNDDDEMFGKERLKETIRANADAPAQQIREAIVRAVETFRGDTPQLDDITLVVVKAR